MASLREQGWYLIALGVLALGLSNSLANRVPGWLQQVSGRSIATAEHLSGCAQQYLAMAQIVLGRGEVNAGVAQAAVGRMQARLGILQANLARHQARMAATEAFNLQMVSVPPIPSIRVACPRIVVQVAEQ